MNINKTKVFTVLGSIVFATLLVFSMAGCDNGGPGGGGDDGGDDSGEFVDGQPSLGATGPGGGKIFYYSAAGFKVYQDAEDTTGVTCHYLEAAPEDLGNFTWASSGHDNDNIQNTETTIGTGKKNTALILAKDPDAPAAKACNEYTNNEKSDWFLPSHRELEQLSINKGKVGNLTTFAYWSSSQSYNAQTAFICFMSDGELTSNGKRLARGSYYPYVRAIRAF